MIQAAELKAAARNLGADLVGIAPVERFAGAPEGFKPTNIMPGAQSVVVMAKRIPKEVVKNGSTNIYTKVCEELFRKLDDMAYELSCFIEDQGGRALPVPADGPYSYWESENTRGMGDLSNRHAGWAAGMGTLGKNSLLITPQFGNRVQLVSVITDLLIEPDPLIEQELCPHKCRLCLESCPTGALAGDKITDQKLCRQNLMTKLSRGFEVYNCRECRKVCPAGAR